MLPTDQKRKRGGGLSSSELYRTLSLISHVLTAVVNFAVWGGSDKDACSKQILGRRKAFSQRVREHSF